MTTSTVFKTDISRFTATVPLTYSGKSLQKINALKRSIQTFGLFSPIIVQRVGASLSVIDGRKRLAALTALIKAGAIPRDLTKVPYVITVNARPGDVSIALGQLPLLSNQQKYHLLLRLVEKNRSLEEIARFTHTTVGFVRDLGNVSKLSRPLKQAFLANTLSLAQAAALSTLPSHKSQEKLLKLLGPFASAPKILAAIHAGETVVNCGENNVIIMPSRVKPKSPVSFAA